MRIENKCEKCEFFKKHTFFTEKGVDTIGGTCNITGECSKGVVANKVVTFEMESQCPLKKISEYDRWRKCWRELRSFVIKLEEQSIKVKGECDRLLREIMFKIKDLEKGE